MSNVVTNILLRLNFYGEIRSGGLRSWATKYVIIKEKRLNPWELVSGFRGNKLRYFTVYCKADMALERKNSFITMYWAVEADSQLLNRKM